MEISSLNENLQLFLEYLCNPSQIRETYSLTSKNWIFCFFKSVIWILILSEKGFPCGSVGKEQPAQAGDIRDVVSIPGSGRSPGGHGNLLHYSCLENPIDRGNWQVAAHRVEKSWTWLKRLSTHALFWESRKCLPLLTPRKLKLVVPGAGMSWDSQLHSQWKESKWIHCLWFRMWELKYKHLTKNKDGKKFLLCLRKLLHFGEVLRGIIWAG